MIVQQEYHGPPPVQFTGQTSLMTQQSILSQDQLPYQSLPMHLMNREDNLSEENVLMRREQGEIYVSGLRMVEWMKVYTLLTCYNYISITLFILDFL